MALKHRVRINIADASGEREPVIRSDVITMPKRLLRWLFGETAEVLVLQPGQSVTSVEIYQDKDGDKDNERNEGDRPYGRRAADRGTVAGQCGRQPDPVVQ